MFVLILVGYVVLGSGQNMSSGIQSPLIVGKYDSEKSCRDAMMNFDRGKSFRDITNNMNEYRWGFLCAPAGDTKN
jgi:hypothetical protein